MILTVTSLGAYCGFRILALSCSLLDRGGVYFPTTPNFPFEGPFAEGRLANFNTTVTNCNE